MAKASYITTLLGGLAADDRKSWQQVFTYLLDNLRLGQPVDQERSENFQAYFYAGTTPAVAGTEFSIAHSFGHAPYLVVPVLPLQVGAQLVPLRVTKAPDVARIYLSSTVANAGICLLIEG